MTEFSERLPLAEADGVFFLTLAKGDRTSIAFTIERLIDMLDVMEADTDLEDTGDDEPLLGWPNAGQRITEEMASDDGRELDNADAEPWLGASERHPASCDICPYSGRKIERRGILRRIRDKSVSQISWSRGGFDDREEENEHASDDSGFGDFSGMEEDMRGEPELGWTEHVDQRRAGEVDRTKWHACDGEPDLGFTGIATGWRPCDGYDTNEDDARNLPPVSVLLT